MTQPDGNVLVTVSGAVQTQGSHALSRPATIRKSLNAAGGLAVPTSDMKPAGVVAVRRPSSGRKVDVYRFFTSEASRDWEEFELRDGDFIIVQCHIEHGKDGARDGRR